MDFPSKVTDSDTLVRVIEQRRWPDGVVCLRCSSSRVGWIRTRDRWDCADCEYQFSATTGTVAHDSKLPLSIWFGVAQLLAENPKASGGLIERTFGITRKTAWFLRRKIQEQPELFRPDTESH